MDTAGNADSPSEKKGTDMSEVRAERPRPVPGTGGPLGPRPGLGRSGSTALAYALRISAGRRVSQ